jgi:hypothetical protein
MIPDFNPCFSSRKIDTFRRLIPKTYRVMEELFDRETDWPDLIEAMTLEEVREGKKQGKGHGLYFPVEKRIKLNHRMSALALYLNFIHENAHHIMPELSDREINNTIVPWVFEEVMGIPIPQEEGESAGVK